MKKNIIVVWQCKYCNSIQVSQSKHNGRLDNCLCRHCTCDCAEYMARFIYPEVFEESIEILYEKEWD